MWHNRFRDYHLKKIREYCSSHRDEKREYDKVYRLKTQKEEGRLVEYEEKRGES